MAGSVVNGIILLKDNRSMVYALGSTIVKRDIVDPKNQQFLQVIYKFYGLNPAQIQFYDVA